MGWNMDKEDLKDIIEKNKDELFSEIAQEINNDNVTDIEWDGYNLWITELGIGSYISGKELSDRYVENAMGAVLYICQGGRDDLRRRLRDAAHFAARGRGE